jgi:hypothetical protein
MFTQFKPSTIAFIVPLLAAVLLPIAAHASPQCTREPKSAWLSEAAMKEKIATMGYHDIKVFKTSGNCYEIYGRDAQGHKAEIYFNPVNGSIVESNVD